MIGSEEEPFLLMALRDDRSIENTVLLALPSIGKYDSKIAQLKVWS